MQSAAELYIDKIQEKGYKMSSCAHSEQWWTQTMRCHACVIENQLCTRVNTIHAFQEANRLLSHNLADFGLQKISSKSKVCVCCQCNVRLSYGLCKQGVSGDCWIASVGVLLGDKISIKHSCIGQHCSIGDKTKIVNCTVMDHVQIGEG